MNTNDIAVLISEEKIQTRIGEIAQQLSNTYKGESVTIICTLKGAVVFAVDLMRKLTLDTEIDFITASSYNGTESTGKITLKKDIEADIEGKNVLLLEDIIDTGLTIKYLKEYLLQKNPKSLMLISLLDKPDRRVADIQGDIIGFKIPDKFIVGYGLDYNQKYRNLPYIGVINA